MLARRPPGTGTPDLVVVWGNCQAGPLAELLRVPLARAGLEVVEVPPVYLATEDEIDRVHRLVRQAALLVSQPIREEYRFGGCGTAALALDLPPGGRLLTVPTTFHTGPFPFLVNAHGADGARVDAPLTDYHDLRAVLAASAGLDLDAALQWWPEASPAVVRIEDADSRERLRRRERGLDVQVSDLVGDPDSLWSMNHPSNRVLAEIARRIVIEAGLEQRLEAPEREFLGARRAPVDATVAAALGWPATAARPRWIADARPLDPADVLTAHLAFYADRRDVVADTVVRYADRISTLPAPRRR